MSCEAEPVVWSQVFSSPSLVPGVSHVDWPQDQQEELDVLYADWFDNRVAVKAQMDQLALALQPLAVNVQLPFQPSVQNVGSVEQKQSYEPIHTVQDTSSPMSTEYL